MLIKIWVEDEETQEILEDLGTILTDSPSRATQPYHNQADSWIEKGYEAAVYWEDITE
jgi:hypothetical protein